MLPESAPLGTGQNPSLLSQGLSFRVRGMETPHLLAQGSSQTPQLIPNLGLSMDHSASSGPWKRIADKGIWAWKISASSRRHPSSFI